MLEKPTISWPLLSRIIGTVVTLLQRQPSFRTRDVANELERAGIHVTDTPPQGDRN